MTLPWPLDTRIGSGQGMWSKKREMAQVERRTWHLPTGVKQPAALVLGPIGDIMPVCAKIELKRYLLSSGLAVPDSVYLRMFFV